MKRTLLALALITTTSTATAIDCAQVGNLAQAFMQSHQDGVPMASIMETIAGVADPTAKQALKDMIIDAYSKPRYNTEQMKRREIADFRDEYAAGCYRGER
jgi:hypothetical protein